MGNEPLAIFMVLALLGKTVTALTPDAGKCNLCNVTTVPVTMDFFEAHKPWKVLYVTDAAPFGKVVSDERNGYLIKDNWYIIMDSMTMTDNSVDRYEFTVSIIDNVIHEESIGKNERMERYTTYPLAMTEENGFLFYRCSDSGQADVDTRYIWIPHNVTLSDAGLQYLMEIDRKCSFRGKLYKLPE